MLKQTLIRTTSALVLAAASACAVAQNYPAKPVRLVVPFAPGGGSDIVGRIIADKLAGMFGQQVLIDNRPGAASVIGTEFVAKSVPDGYTLVLQVNALAANHALYPKRGYDTLKDFAPVILAASTPNVLVVHPSLPVRNAVEFVALAKRRPNEITYASSGAGSASYLAAELLKLLTGVKLLHVPYKGTGPALVAIMSGEVQVMAASLPGTIPYIKDGRMRALGVTGAKRASSMPQLPTLIEAGIKDFEFETWYGIFAPAAVPRDVIAKLNTSINSILAMPDVKDLYARQGLEPAGGTPEQFSTYFRAEVDRLGKVVQASGTKPD